MAKGTDSTRSGYQEGTFAVADEGMTNDEALAFLSDEEREALKATDEEVSEGEDTSGENSNRQTEDEEDGHGKSEDPGTDKPGHSEDDGQAEEPDEARDDQQEADQARADSKGLEEDLDPGDGFVPKYTVDTGGIEERQSRLDSDYAEAKKTLDSLYAAGDIDEMEFNRRKDAMSEIRFKEQREIDKALIKAEIAAEQNAQYSAQSWDTALAKFMAANKDIRSSRVLTGAMQAEINAIGEEFAGKNLSYSKILDMAKTRVYRELGKPLETPRTKADAVKQLAQGRGAKPSAPKTLANIPSDKSASDKFDDIASLSGLAYEDALARLTQDELDRWSRG